MLSESTISSIVSARTLKSPVTSIATFCVKSPLEIAVTILATSCTGLAIESIKRFSVSTTSFQLPLTPSTVALSPSLPSTPATLATLATSPASLFKSSTMPLIASARAFISPAAGISTFCVRSPFDIPTVTLAIPLTCAVSVSTNPFSVSTTFFQDPATPGTSACTPSFPATPTSLATLDTSDANVLSESTILLIVFDKVSKSPATFIVTFCVKSPLAIAVTILPTSCTGPMMESSKVFSVSTMSFQLPLTPSTVALSLSLPPTPATFATRETSVANLFRSSTVLLITSARSLMSPAVSICTFWVRSPPEIAVIILLTSSTGLAIESIK